MVAANSFLGSCKTKTLNSHSAPMVAIKPIMTLRIVLAWGVGVNTSYFAVKNHSGIKKPTRPSINNNNYPCKFIVHGLRFGSNKNTKKAPKGAFQIVSVLFVYPLNASAPATISKISFVMAACRALLYVSFN